MREMSSFFLSENGNIRADSGFYNHRVDPLTFSTIPVSSFVAFCAPLHSWVVACEIHRPHWWQFNKRLVEPLLDVASHKNPLRILAPRLNMCSIIPSIMVINHRENYDKLMSFFQHRKQKNKHTHTVAFQHVHCSTRTCGGPQWIDDDQHTFLDRLVGSHSTCPRSPV